MDQEDEGWGRMNGGGGLFPSTNLTHDWRQAPGEGGGGCASFQFGKGRSPSSPTYVHTCAFSPLSGCFQMLQWGGGVCSLRRRFSYLSAAFSNAGKGRLSYPHAPPLRPCQGGFLILKEEGVAIGLSVPPLPFLLRLFAPLKRIFIL